MSSPSFPADVARECVKERGESAWHPLGAILTGALLLLVPCTAGKGVTKNTTCPYPWYMVYSSTKESTQTIRTAC